MTFAVFIILFVGLFIAVLNFLPTAVIIPMYVWDSIHSLFLQAYAWNTWLPLSTAFTIIVYIILPYEIGSFIFRVLLKTIAVIRGGTDG